MRTYNNLGVTVKRLSESPRNPEKEAQALVYFTKSSEVFDVLNREPDTLTRGDTKNLGFLNTRAVLYPQVDFSIQIYNRIPLDSTTSRF